jgi:hypothetical protein
LNRDDNSDPHCQACGRTLRIRDAVARGRWCKECYEARSGPPADFLREVERALDDEILTAEEESDLVKAAEALGIEPWAIVSRRPELEEQLEVARVNAGRLPDLIDAEVRLGDGEKAHLAVEAELLREKVETVHRGGGSGFSFKIAPGVRYRTSSYRGRTVEVGTYLAAADRGRLVVTSERTLFLGSKETVEIPHKKLLALTPYRGAVQVHASGRKHAPLFRLMQPHLLIATVNATAQRLTSGEPRTQALASTPNYAEAPIAASVRLAGPVATEPIASSASSPVELAVPAAVSQASERLPRRSPNRGARLGEADLTAEFRDALDAMLPSGWTRRTHGMVFSPQQWPRKSGGVDVIVDGPNGRALFFELKFRGDNLFNCPWDLAKMGLASATLACEHAYLLAGAETTEWQQPGGEFFSDNTWPFAAYTGGAHEAAWHRWLCSEQLPAPKELPAEVTTALVTARQCMIEGREWELRLVEVAASENSLRDATRWIQQLSQR